MSVAVHIDDSGVRRLSRRLGDLRKRMGDPEPLLDRVGALLDSQAQRRIAEEKASPDGEQWPDWSDDYAATRHGGHSLLMNEGDLVQSIQHLVDGYTLEHGSNLVYARTHQEGDPSRNIPQREFLGISDDNAREIDEVIGEWMAEQAGEAT